MARRFAELITAAEWLIVMALAPALLFPTPGRLLALTAVPVMWVCAWVVTGRALPRTPLNVALGVLLTMVVVSLFATFDLRFSLGKVSGVVLGALVFWTVTRWVTTPRRLAAVTAVFVLAGSGLAIIGLLGANWFAKFSLLGVVGGRLPRVIRGMTGAEEGFQPNAVGGCLVLFVP